jgi:predicted N-acetyltransferase YhbS
MNNGCTHQAIYQVNKLAFGQNGESDLVEKLRKKPAYVKALSQVAELDHVVIGHILFTPILIKSASRRTESLALAPMAVLSAYQRKGIGGKLIRAGLHAARNAGFRSVIVLGHPAYYPKFDFQPASKWQIQAPFPVPDEAFMAIELETDALANAQGIVFYPEEFMEV